MLKIQKEYLNENIELVKKGLSILKYHINLVSKVFGLNCIVAVNQFAYFDYNF